MQAISAAIDLFGSKSTIPDSPSDPQAIDQLWAYSIIWPIMFRQIARFPSSSSDPIATLLSPLAGPWMLCVLR
jgi:hypothetical protein